MSEQNVELHRRVIEAYNARDIEAMIAFCAPEVEFHSAMAAVTGATYHGHEGVRSWHRDLEDAWGGETRIHPEAFFDLGDQTLAFNVVKARGRQSGAEVAMPAAQVVRWRKGLCVYCKGYVNRDDALRELKISQQELVPIAP